VFVPTADEQAKDWADLAVDFGGYQYSMFFNPTASNYSGLLPRRPPPADTTCNCPSCASEGWYAQSPRCRFWRADCDICAGHRVFRLPGEGRDEDCELCAAAWSEDVRFFRDALRSPARTARRLREEAASRRSS
jgi:hypothetical protein